MQASSVSDEVKAWIKSNKGNSISVSFVSGKVDCCTVDLDGFEGKLVSKNGTLSWTTEDEDSGFQALSEHLSSFCSARSRSVADVLTEAVRSFSKFVKDDEGAQSDSEGGSDADEEEREINGWVNEEPVKKAKQTPADHVDASIFNMPSIARAAATQRLIADFASLKASDTKAIGFVAEPWEKNLYRWHVRLFPPADSDLYKDLQKTTKKSIFSKKVTNEPCIELEMLFPSEYPNDPPFIRVLQPRFALRSGHVTIGGSICMDLLTNSGWSPVNSIESILIQIRTEMVEGGGRLDLNNQNPYTVQEAKEAFIRVAGQHGWTVPPMQNLPWE